MSAYSRPPPRCPRSVGPNESVSQIGVPNALSHVHDHILARTEPGLQDQADQVSSMATGFPIVTSPSTKSLVLTGIGLGTELSL